MSDYTQNKKIKLTALYGLSRDGAAGARSRELATARQPGNPSGTATATGGFEDRFGPEASDHYSVIFANTPDITESGGVNYDEVNGMRSAAGILIYTGTQSRTFTLSVKLISRTAEEAAISSLVIRRLKSWRMPESLVEENGNQSNVAAGGGLSVPTILLLSGYGDTFRDIPVVLTDLSVEWSSEHDFVRSVPLEGKPYAIDIPIITPISITLKEAHNTDAKGIMGADKSTNGGLGGFDILKYRSGTLPHW